MAKGIKDSTRTQHMLNNFAVSDAADAIGTHVDMRTSRNGLLIISKLGAGVLTNIGVYSSESNTFLTKSTAASSALVVPLTQDTRNSASDITISSNVITSITTAGTYIFNLASFKRYVNIQFDPATSDIGITRQNLTATVVGLDLEQAPSSDAQGAYT